MRINYIFSFTTLTQILLIEIFAVFVFLYWFLKPKEESREISVFSKINPFFLELILLFLILTVSIEVRPVYHPIIWISSAVICLLIGKYGSDGFSRLKLYSLFLSIPMLLF